MEENILVQGGYLLMANFILRRAIYMLIVICFISVVSFIIVQLPPGDFLTTRISILRESGADISMEKIEALKAAYGLDKPAYVQYFKWISGIIFKGDFGWSFEWEQPVSQLIWSRLGLTLVVSFSALMFTWVVALPIGIYSAVKQYSPGDYLVTFIGFIGLATPNFMLALILMWIAFNYYGMNVTGLFSEQFIDAPWNIAKIIDLLKHLWLPMIVVGTAGTASLIRIMRANLLDELNKPYVDTARAKGLNELQLLLKYPVKLALNPFISRVGWSLPRLISGAVITSVVLNLPTSGALFLRSLKSQDMYLAGSFVLLLSILTVIGTFISDLLLAWIDPRITYN